MSTAFSSHDTIQLHFLHARASILTIARISYGNSVRLSWCHVLVVFQAQVR